MPRLTENNPTFITHLFSEENTYKKWPFQNHRAEYASKAITLAAYKTTELLSFLDQKSQVIIYKRFKELFLTAYQNLRRAHVDHADPTLSELIDYATATCAARLSSIHKSGSAAVLKESDSKFNEADFYEIILEYIDYAAIFLNTYSSLELLLRTIEPSVIHTTALGKLNNNPLF